MSLWADYYKERENAETIEIDEGFITYKFIDESTCLITNAYVDKEVRRRGFLRYMVDEVTKAARNKHCNRLLVVVDLLMNDASRNIGIYIHRGGLKISSIEGSKVYLERGI